MDIVTLQNSHSNRRHRKPSSRRHTTEVCLEQLSPPSSSSSSAQRGGLGERSQSSENISDRGSSSSLDDPAPTDRNSFSSSWNSLLGGSGEFGRGSVEVSDLHFFESGGGSQSDLFQELSELEPRSRQQLDTASRHQYQLSYELALDNVLTPFASNPAPTISPLATDKGVSHMGRVLQELVTTEKSYVHDLNDIIAGYVEPLESRVGALPLQSADLARVFGNLREISDFHSSLLAALVGCGRDPTKVGECFVEKAEDFKIYTQYCNNYPNSIKTLVELSRNSEISRFLKVCQRRLNHMLPLGAYLLKPVQRVLKYSLLLDEMVKHMKVDSNGYHYLTRALVNMTQVAEHINAMKKKYDAAVHVQEVQNLIRGWEGSDLTKYGDLVLEESFRYSGGKSSSAAFRRSERYLFLFQRLCLLTKREEDLYLYKTHLEMKDLQLTEKMEKDVTSFQIRQVSTGRAFTFQARNLLIKERWVRTIKLLLMESIPHLPDKAKLLILSGFPTMAPSDAHRKSPRQRHFSEDPQSPSRKAKNTSGSVTSSGNHSKTLSLLNDKETRRRRPNLQLKPTTRSLVQATFAALHSPPRVESPLSEGECSTPPPSDTSTAQRDSSYSETSTVTSEQEARLQPQATLVGQSVETEVGASEPRVTPRHSPRLFYSRLRSASRSRSSTPDLEEPRSKRHASPLLTTSSDTALLATITTQTTATNDTEHSDIVENSLDNPADTTMTPVAAAAAAAEEEEEEEEEEDERNELTRINSVEEGEAELEPCPNGDIIIRPPSMFSDEDSPVTPSSARDDQSEHRYKFTDDDESLFNDLMHTSSGRTAPLDYAANGYRNSSFNRTEAQLLQHTLHELQNENEESENGLQYLHVLPPEEFAGPPGVFEEDTSVTPKASPFPSPSLARRWAVNGLDADDVTPHSTPNPQRKETLTPANTFIVIPEYNSFASPTAVSELTAPRPSVVRRHSIGSNFQRAVVHKREGSLSTDNSPNTSPRPKSKKKTSKEKQKSSSLKRNTSFSRENARISLVGLVSSSRTDLSEMPSIHTEHVDDLSSVPHRHSLILPPPDEFGVHNEVFPDTHLEKQDPFLESEIATSVSSEHTSDDSRESSPRVEHQKVEEKPSKPLSWFQRQRKHTKASTSSPNISARIEKEPAMDTLKVPSEAASPITVIAPYEGNPEETLSFDEILESFGEYASATGKSAKCIDVSPQPKRKKGKKKGRRSMTVAAIDANTMMQVKEEIARNERKRTNSKVQQLAREYSRRIKDQNSKTKLRKRFSTVVEEPDDHYHEASNGEEPPWLQNLKQKRRYRTVSGQDELSPSDYCDAGPQTDYDSRMLGGSMGAEEGHRVQAKAATLPRTSSEEGIYLLHKTTDNDMKKGGFKGFVKNIVAKFSKEKN